MTEFGMSVGRFLDDFGMVSGWLCMASRWFEGQKPTCRDARSGKWTDKWEKAYAGNWEKAYTYAYMYEPAKPWRTNDTY